MTDKDRIRELTQNLDRISFQYHKILKNYIALIEKYGKLKNRQS